MCKFCEDTKRQRILSYNNRKNMRVSFGQYKGTFVDSDIHMEGNMLLLGATGSYRSDFDCYYESQGLDIDNERGAKCKDTYIKIEYCPFCGRKLTSTLYEQTKAADDIIDLQEKLRELESDLDNEQLFIYFEWTPKGAIFDDNGKLDWDASIKNPKWDRREYKNDMTLPELYNHFENIKIKIYYGSKNLRKERHYKKFAVYSLDDKIHCGCYAMGTFYTGGYALPEDVYKKLIELNYIKYNQNELEELHIKQNKIKENIKQVKREISDLKKYIKELKSK